MRADKAARLLRNSLGDVQVEICAAIRNAADAGHRLEAAERVAREAHDPRRPQVRRLIRAGAQKSRSFVGLHGPPCPFLVREHKPIALFALKLGAPRRGELLTQQPRAVRGVLAVRCIRIQGASSK
jgi:hypothetical protein